MYCDILMFFDLMFVAQVFNKTVVRVIQIRSGDAVWRCVLIQSLNRRPKAGHVQSDRSGLKLMQGLNKEYVHVLSYLSSCL